MLDDIKDVFDKLNKDKYVIGFDLNEKYSQVSFCRIDSNQPETYSLVQDQEEYNIPLAIVKLRDGNRYLIGKEALEAGETMGLTVVTNLLDGAVNDALVTIEKEEYKVSDLLLMYIKRCLFLLPVMETPDKIAGIAITVRNADNKIISILSTLSSILKLGEDKIHFLSYEESFFYYMAYQSGELQNHHVLLCDATGDMIRTYRLERNHFVTPVIASVEVTAHPEIRVDEDGAVMGNNADARFLNICKASCGNAVYSGVYLIGEGFYSDWCNESLRFLCKGRRVFKGNNLFGKGACFAARDKAFPGTLEKRIRYLGKDRVKAEIGLELMHKGAVSKVPLIKSGSRWFEASGRTEVILKESDSIPVYFDYVGKKTPVVGDLRLEGLPHGIGYCTRVEVSMSLSEEKKVVIKVKDLGFGEIYPSTGGEWEEEMELEG